MRQSVRGSKQPSPSSRKLAFRSKTKEFPSPQPPNLIPDPLPAVVGPEFCAPRTLELAVVVRWLNFPSGDTIQFSHGDRSLLFKVDVPSRGPNFQIKRVLQNAMGTPIACTQKKQLLTLRNQWDAHRGNQCEKGNRIFKVKKSSYFQQKTSLDVFMTDPTTKSQPREPDFRVKGNYFDRSCTVMRGATQAIAEIKPSGTGLWDKKNFMVTVYAGVDTAFIALLVVIMEELHRERDNEP